MILYPIPIENISHFHRDRGFSKKKNLILKQYIEYWGETDIEYLIKIPKIREWGVTFFEAAVSVNYDGVKRVININGLQAKC